MHIFPRVRLHAEAREMLEHRVMRLRRATFLASIALGLTSTFAAMSGCADEDPRFGGAGAIKNIHVFEQGTADVEGGAGMSARTLFGPVYNTLKGPCGGCHAPPGAPSAPVFLGATEESSYASFKARHYDVEGGKPDGRMYALTDRGAHSGRVLTDAEKKVIARWREAEKAGASAASDAGGGGDG